tara:strand:- start:219 stop:1454 length:1236 start_codon:yes stop_codon:yes gene_type:complete
MTTKFRNILHTLVIFLIITFLLNSKILSNFLWAMPELFSDFSAVINWLECDSLGFNLITLESINCGTGKTIGQFNYGYAILYIPYNEFLSIFYRTYLPWILIFTFIYLTLKIINPKNKIEIILVYLALLNPSTMLLVERMQLDCLFYIVIIFTVYNRLYFINWFLGVYFALIKIYPIIILLNIFIENKNRNIKKIFFITLLLLITLIIYLFFNRELYTFMLNNMLSGKPGYHFLYSLNSLPKIFTYIFDINYQFLLLIFYSLFIIITVKLYKMITLNYDNMNVELYAKDSKLFIIGGYFSLFLFVLVSSFVYKEIFIILLIPFILNIKNNHQEKLFSILLYLVIARYCYLFLYAFLNIHDGVAFVNGQRIFSNEFLFAIFLKSILDFALMCFISAILYMKTKIYILDKFKK